MTYELNDHIQRDIAVSHQDRLPKLPDGPYFIAPDSAPSISGETMDRIGPDSTGKNNLELMDWDDLSVVAERERLSALGSNVISSALTRIEHRLKNT